jgi:hypothetical protein
MGGRFTSDMGSRVNFGTRFLFGAAVLALATLWFFWPGVAMYDSVTQYTQVLSGRFDDWHPPVMARLWQGFHAIGWPGQSPMLVVQLLLYWLGLGLIAGGLARAGSRTTPWLVLLIGLWPVFLGWQASVLKDGQMVGALLAATGLVAWWRLSGGRMPGWAVALAGVLIGYALLVRFNAVFAVVPLALLLAYPKVRFRSVLMLSIMGVAVLGVLAVMPAINHGPLGARPSGAERSLYSFDLAGIVAHAGPEAVPLLPAPLWRAAIDRGCIKPLLWDPLDDPSRCGFVGEGLKHAAPGPALGKAWRQAVLAHPIAYAAHRLAHWNATMRLWMPASTPLAEPQSGSEPNAVGLTSPDTRVVPVQSLAGTLARTPLGAPIVWLALAAGVLIGEWRGKRERSGLAVALAGSAIAGELSFLLVSVSSDLRYHLWAMIAAGLALLITGTTSPHRRWSSIALLVGAAMLIVLTAQMVLPPIGNSYSDALR